MNPKAIKHSFDHIPKFKEMTAQDFFEYMHANYYKGFSKTQMYKELLALSELPAAEIKKELEVMDEDPETDTEEAGEDEPIQVAEKKKASIKPMVKPQEDDSEIPITTTIAFQNMKIMKEMTKYMGEMASDVDYKKDAKDVKDSVEALQEATVKIAKMEKLIKEVCEKMDKIEATIKGDKIDFYQMVRKDNGQPDGFKPIYRDENVEEGMKH